MSDMLRDVERMEAAFTEAMGKARSLEDVERLRLEYLGKKGALTGLLRLLGQAAPEERPALGQAVNRLRDACEESLKARTAELREPPRPADVLRERADAAWVAAWAAAAS